MKSPPSVKDIPFMEHASGTPTTSLDYTPKKLKKFFSLFKKSSAKKKMTKYVKTFKELVINAAGHGESAHSSSEEESEHSPLNMMQDASYFTTEIVKNFFIAQETLLL